MVKASPMVRSFNAGVISQLMQGRTDFERYPAACRILHNMIAAPQGPAICRSGTMFMSPAARHEQESFLIPFVFSNEQSKVLEFANDRIRFLDEDGIQIYDPVAFTLSTQSPFVITSASLAANENDDVVLTGFPDDYNLNGEIARVLSKSGNDYTLDLTWPSGKANHNGTVARVYHVVMDFTDEQRERMRIVQSVDVMYLLTGSQPRKLLRYGSYDWRLETINFVDGPYLPINITTTKMAPSSTGNAIPNMTNNTTPSGTASGSSQRGSKSNADFFLDRDINWNLIATDYYMAFNDNDAQYWAADASQKGYIQYDFGVTTAIDGYSILVALEANDPDYLLKDFAPGKFQLMGSPNGSTWTILDDQQDYVLYDNNKSRFIDLKETVSYRYYRLNIDKLFRNGQIEPRVRRLVLRATGRGAAADITAGTTIHNATSNQDRAFNGQFNEGNGNCARKSAGASNSMYLGKTFATQRVVGFARFSGSNDNGYTNYTPGSNATTAITARLYGKTGVAPANGTDGTLLGTMTFNDEEDIPNQSAIRTIPSTDTSTAWDHVWINFSQGQNVELYVAEVQLFGWTTTGAMEINATSVVGINRDQGFLAGDVGRVLRLKGKDNYWRPLRITSVLTTTKVTVDLEGEPFPDLTATREWRLGAWGDSVGWPTCGDFFEDRLALAGSTEFPDLFALSVIGEYETFSQTDEFGVVLDESAVVARLNARKLSGIRWLAGDEKGLLIGTGSGEYVLSSVKGDTESVTARNIKARNSTSRGSADVEPVKIDRQVLYVQRAGRTLREMAYVFEADGYKSPSMSQLASHLGVKRFKELDYAAEPHSLVWVRREDGTVVCLTYNRDENVVGWHTHDFGGTVESMTVVPAADQLQDTLWIIVNRTINGQTRRYIERLTRFWDFDMTLADAHYLDCAIRYSGSPITTVYGLQHLEGQELYGLADQKPIGPYTVENGTVILDHAASEILLGIGYDSEGETVRLENGAADGTAIGKLGRTNNVSMLLWDSYGGEIGIWTMTDTNGDGQGDKEFTPVEYPWRTDLSTVVELFTGEVGPIIVPGHDKKCSIGFKRPKSSPVPFNTVALLPQMSKEDR